MNTGKDVELSVTKSGGSVSETGEAKHSSYHVTTPNKSRFTDQSDYSRGTVQQETTNVVLGESETKNTDRLDTFQPPSGFGDSGKSFYIILSNQL